MAEVKIPFCATAEVPPPFRIDEKFVDPNGVKSVLFDKSALEVRGREEMIDVPNIGPVKMCVFYVTGTIPYICNAFPLVEDEGTYDVQEQAATFNADYPSSVDAETVTSTAFGWLSASGCVNVEASVGGNISLEGMPEIESVTVEDLAVANNVTSAMNPTASVEENKRVVKWRGNFVIKTT